MYKIIVFFVVLSLCVFLLYYPLYFGFFQQDEFMAFGSTYSFGNNWFWNYIFDSFRPNPGHYTPLFISYYGILFNWIGIAYQKWLTASLVWHVVNSFLIYVLTKKIFNNELLARVGAFVFAVFAAGQQGTSWVVADGNTHGATFFVLLSLIYLFKFLENNKKFPYQIFVSLTCLLLSLLFKEISIGMFLFIPLVMVVNNYIVKNRLLDKYVVVFLGVGFLYFVFRYLSVSLFSHTQAPVVTGSQSLTEIATNIAIFPVKSVSQTLVPSYTLLKVSKYLASIIPEDISGTIGTTDHEIFYLKYILGSLDWMVFIAVFALVIKTSITNKNRNGLIIGLSFAFIVVNSIVYALSPGRSSFIPIIDSRNLYMPSIGMIFLILALSSTLFRSRWGAFLIILPILLLNVLVTRIEINKVSEPGNIRKNILNQISSDYPRLSNKQILYFESDTSYFGLPDEVKILPFQSGIGQTLLVWYEKTEHFPTDFFAQEYLWPIDSQGYKEIDDRGFGYFREFSLLNGAVKAYNLPVNSVVAYSWDSKTKWLTNITEEVRLKLSKND